MPMYGHYAARCHAPHDAPTTPQTPAPATEEVRVGDTFTNAGTDTDVWRVIDGPQAYTGLWTLRADGSGATAITNRLLDPAGPWRRVTKSQPCGCGGDGCSGVDDNERHQCGGPAEACAVVGCKECGSATPRMVPVVERVIAPQPGVTAGKWVSAPSLADLARACSAAIEALHAAQADARRDLTHACMVTLAEAQDTAHESLRAFAEALHERGHHMRADVVTAYRVRVGSGVVAPTWALSVVRMVAEVGT